MADKIINKWFRAYKYNDMMTLFTAKIAAAYVDKMANVI